MSSFLLTADNRSISNQTLSSSLSGNYASGQSIVNVVNATPFSVGDLIVIGEIGQPDSELFKIGALNTSTGDITLYTVGGSSTTTKRAHSESSRVAVVSYDQVKFYWSPATGTIADENPLFAYATLQGTVSVDVSLLNTTYEDPTHTSGFGWFVYYNSQTTATSANSNPVPFADFALNTVASIFGDFDSGLNVNELSLVSFAEKFSWVNEALVIVKNKLNLSQAEYTISPEVSVTLTPGLIEYQLYGNVTDIVTVTTEDGYPIDFINVADSKLYSGPMAYYLRNRYIGIVPAPSATSVIKYTYRQAATRLTSKSDYIDLPDGMHYALKEYMLHKAFMKFKDVGMARSYLDSFTNMLNMAVMSAVKRANDRETWGITSNSNV